MGVASEQAEAHAEAARDFVMAELVTKSDLLAATASLRQEIAARFQTVDARSEKMEMAIDNLTLRMTVRLGGIVAIGVAILAAIIKL